MLCGIHPQSSPHHSRFLRSFRSHKNLRHNNNNNNSHSSSSFSSRVEMQQHKHLPSDASSSSLSRPSFESSPRPSTSSRSDMSIDWDPLRLHPSRTGPAPPLSPLQDTFTTHENTSRRYLPQELRHARSSHSLRSSSRQTPPSPARQTPSSNTVIYDGFDFGFNNTPTPAMSKTTPSAITTTTPDHPRRRSPSPAPSDASSECSLSLGGCSDSDSLPLEEMGLTVGLAPAPALRAPRPRPRPRVHHQDGGPSAPGLGGLDGDAEYFIRRGGWKRRGIVFVNSGEELAGEEETFEI